MSVSLLQQQTGEKIKFIQQALILINRNGGYYMFSQDATSIVDNRLEKTFMLVENCDSCGGNINKKVSLNFREDINCPYCGCAQNVNYLNAIKERTLQAIDEQERAQKGNGQFSLLIFLFLLVVVWPVAILYFIYANRAVIVNKSLGVN